jgi:hypothetical protein
MTAKDVFTPFSFPTVTFIDEHLVHRATILKDALEIGNCVIAISGPSKSRKTVFVENLVSHDSMIHVTGSGAVKQEAKRAKKAKNTSEKKQNRK